MEIKNEGDYYEFSQMAMSEYEPNQELIKQQQQKIKSLELRLALADQIINRRVDNEGKIKAQK